LFFAPLHQAKFLVLLDFVVNSQRFANRASVERSGSVISKPHCGQRTNWQPLCNGHD